MSKLVDIPVRVIIDNDNSGLKRFLWNRRWFEIETIEGVWPVSGRWWKDESEKMFFRVEAGGILFELCKIGAGNRSQWRLYKIYG